MRRLVVTTAFFSGLALLWHLAAASGRWSPVLLPAPLDVARYLAAAAVDGSLLSAGLVTGRRLAVGYALGIALGVPFGCLTARFRGCADTLGVVALGLQTLPSVCWVPLALLWFGPTEAAVLFVVVMGTTWSIQIATDDGLRSIPPIYVRAARTMGSRGLHTVVRVLVPASLPAVVSGMKQGWAFAWRSLMAGELIYYSLSLGNLLQTGRDLNDVAMVMSVMALIVVVGVSVDQLLFAPLERRVRERWGFSAQSR